MLQEEKAKVVCLNLVIQAVPLVQMILIIVLHVVKLERLLFLEFVNPVHRGKLQIIPRKPAILVIQVVQLVQITRIIVLHVVKQKRLLSLEFVKLALQTQKFQIIPRKPVSLVIQVVQLVQITRIIVLHVVKQEKLLSLEFANPVHQEKLQIIPLKPVNLCKILGQLHPLHFQVINLLHSFIFFFFSMGKSCDWCRKWDSWHHNIGNHNQVHLDEEEILKVIINSLEFFLFPIRKYEESPASPTEIKGLNL